jgi:hypothetical protein
LEILNWPLKKRLSSSAPALTACIRVFLSIGKDNKPLSPEGE